MLAFIPRIGGAELLILLVALLVLFANRLPAAARGIGRGITEFKNGLSGKDSHSEDER